MTKNKLAFIGHSFHKKTLSNEFFLDFLKDEYEISLFWDESWRGGDRVDIAAISSEFETFVFFQTMYESEDLKTIEEKNITFVPMYDGVYEKTKKSWKQYRDYKFICFSSVLYRRLEGYGFDALRIKYYPPAENEADLVSSGKPTVYFWQRVDEISWHDIRHLISPDQVEKVIINNSVDPGCTFIEPSLEDVKAYKIDVVSWFDSKKEYFEMLQLVDIVIAPRPYEGIGFSFLNAMARGKVIMAMDLPTANEYVNVKTGYLWQKGQKDRVDLSGFREKAEASWAEYNRGAKKSLEYEGKVLEYIAKRPSLWQAGYRRMRNWF